MKTFWQLVVASVKDIGRDRMSLFWFLAFPVLFILLFGWIYSNEGNRSYEVGMVSQAGSPLSEGVTAGISAVPVFKVHAGTKDDELQALRKGKRSLVVDVSSLSSEAMVSSSVPLKVYVYYDKTQTTAQQVLLPVIRQVFDEIERHMTGRPRMFDVVAEPVQRTAMRMIDFLLPGVLAMAVMQLGLFGSLRAVSLREQKILKSLGATPLPRYLLLVSEVLVRITMALIQTFAIVLIGYLAFRVTVLGSWFAVLGIVLLGALTFVSMGYMLASFPRTEEAGMGLVQLIQFPMMFLSGIFFPVDFMPSFLRPVVTVMPLTYLADLLRQVMVGAPPLHSVSTNLAVLGGWTIVTLILATRFWRWE
ncbi:MAG: ABC transporter permease [Bacillota bacterium]